jgi:hypothetical protein
MGLLIEVVLWAMAIAYGGIFFRNKFKEYPLVKWTAGMFAVAGFTLTFFVPAFRNSTELPLPTEQPMNKSIPKTQEQIESIEEKRARLDREKLLKKQKLEYEQKQKELAAQQATIEAEKEESRQNNCKGEIEALVARSYQYSDKYKELSRKMVLEQFYVTANNDNSFDFNAAENENCQNATMSFKFSQLALEKYESCKPFYLQNKPFVGQVETDYGFYKTIVETCGNRQN